MYVFVVYITCNTAITCDNDDDEILIKVMIAARMLTMIVMMYLVPQERLFEILKWKAVSKGKL